MDPVDKVRLLGVQITNITSDELNEAIHQIVRANRRELVLNVNIHAMNLACRLSWFRDLLNRAEIVFCDGDGVRLGAWLQSNRLRQKITYNRWIWDFARFSEAKGLSWFLIGGTEEVIQEAVVRLRNRFPRLQIKGWRNGYFHSNEEVSHIKDVLNESNPNILILGMGMPLQEAWLRENRADLFVNVALTGGAVFDYVSGRVKMTPHLFYRLKLEWLYRFAHEPKRLFIRYFIGNPLFLLRVLLERFGVQSFNRSPEGDDQTRAADANMK
jgi:N-acetylglucosaminyldiphosphoundecaprenol N-acetyl-beta-D-mannosaminyltransferase